MYKRQSRERERERERERGGVPKQERWLRLVVGKRYSVRHNWGFWLRERERERERVQLGIRVRVQEWAQWA